MKICRSAGRQCPREATVTVRIFKVGDRDLCAGCHDALVAMGMEVRVLDPNQYVPEWRKRDLRKSLSTEPAL